MRQGPAFGVGEEGDGYGVAPGAACLVPRGPHRGALGPIGRLHLMVARSVLQQTLGRRGRVVFGGFVDAHDALVRPHLELRS